MSDSSIVVCPTCQSPNRIPSARLGDQPKCGKCKQPLFEGHPIPLTDQTFDKHLTRSDLPLVVDFWAPWCGPCRVMAPAFEQAARQLEPDVRLLKVNTEEQQAIAAQFGIRSIPTMILFARERELSRMSGALDASGIVAWTRQHLR